MACDEVAMNLLVSINAQMKSLTRTIETYDDRFEDIRKELFLLRSLVAKRHRLGLMYLSKLLQYPPSNSSFKKREATYLAWSYLLQGGHMRTD
jgi:hypothetical protein